MTLSMVKRVFAPAAGLASGILIVLFTLGSLLGASIALSDAELATKKAELVANISSSAAEYSGVSRALVETLFDLSLKVAFVGMEFGHAHPDLPWNPIGQALGVLAFAVMLSAYLPAILHYWRVA